jgi:hypothetical protein
MPGAAGARLDERSALHRSKVTRRGKLTLEMNRPTGLEVFQPAGAADV